MKKKIFKLLLVLALIVIPITGLKINADATNDLTLGTQISDNPDDRLFTVTNNSNETISYAYETNGASGQKTLAPGKQDIIRVKATGGSANLAIRQLPDGTIQQIASLNQYYVTINFTDENGNAIATKKQAIATYNSGCTYTSASVINYNGNAYDIKGNNYVAIPYGTTSYTFQYVRRLQPNFLSSVILVDQDGLTHRTITYDVSETNGGKTTVPESFVSTVNGRTYKIMNGYSTTVSQSYGQGQLQTVIRYQVQEDETAKPYNITVQYVDQSSNSVLLTKTLLVQNKKTVEHTPSNSFMKNGKLYQLVNGNKISHTFGDNQKTYQVFYQQVETDDTTSQPLQVNYIDLATGNLLEIHEYSVDPGKTKTIDLESSIEQDEKTYILNSSQPSYVNGTTITHKFGTTTTQYDVYFVEKGLEIDSYEVSITYLDVSHTNVGEETIYTTKVIANVDEPLSIDVPLQYESNGKTYILLAGQDNHYDHEFYSTRRNYVLVYRDINDTNNEIVLNQTVEETTSLPTTTLTGTTTDGTMITIDGATGNPVINNPDGTVTTVDQDGNIVPYEQQETEIIEEDETPLTKGTKQETSKSNSSYSYLIGGGAAIAVAIVVFIYYLKKRKSKQA